MIYENKVMAAAMMTAMTALFGVAVTGCNATDPTGASVDTATTAAGLSVSVDGAKVTYSPGAQDYFEKGAWVGRVEFPDDAHVVVTTSAFRAEANADDSLRLDDAASLANALAVSGNDAASLKPLASVCSTLDANQDEVFDAVSTHDGGQDAHVDAVAGCNWGAVWDTCQASGYQSARCQSGINGLLGKGC